VLSTVTVTVIVTGIVAAIAGSLAVGRSYSRWTARRRQELEREAQVAQTASGPVEYALVGPGFPALDGPLGPEAAPVVLVSHGTPGGYDQGLGVAALLREWNLRVLAVSRPGYLRTPLESGRTPAEQADVFAALLDELGLRTAAVLGLSGGGPAAIEFARRHPDRCSGLILVAAVTERIEPQPMFLDRVLSSDFGAWALTRFPWAVVRALEPAVEYRRLVAATLRDRPEVRRLLESAAPSTPRQAGVRNDDLQFAGYAPTLAEVACPTLVVHGARDTQVPIAFAQRAAGAVSGARSMVLEDGGHLSFAARPGSLAGAIVELLGERP
jgi:pimeloyl-ACP methyl ester carboxylesterase